MVGDPGARREAERAGLVLVHDQHRRGAVGDLRGRAGRVQAVGQDGLELGEPLERGVAQALVGVDGAGLAGGLALGVEDRCLHREDLALEATLVDGDARLLLRGQAELVDELAREAAVRSDPVGRLELVGHVDVPVVRTRVAETGRHVAAERDARHRLDAARDADVDAAGLDHVVDHVRGLLARAALRVDDGAGGVLGEAGVQPGAAHRAVGLLTGLGDDAADDLLDQVRVDPGAPQHLGLGLTQQHRGVHAGEPALPLAEGGADGVDDHGVAHGPKLEHVLRFDKARRASIPYCGYVTSATRTCSSCTPWM